MARVVNAAADVIHRAQGNGARTAAGLAVALDAAQMLMSPETAAELERLREQVAKLLAERHSTNDALADVTVAQRSAEVSADRLTRLLAPTQALREDEAVEPVQLRWGLNDVMWGDDDTVTVLMSGPKGEPYWLELDQERATVLRTDLAGPDGVTVYRASHDSIVMGLYATREAAQAHCEAMVQQEEPAGSIRHLSWSADDIGPDAEYELHITPTGTGELIRGTGYVVASLDVASEYDAEADS